MSQMTAVQVSGPGGPFEVVKRVVPEPGAKTVRIKIQACGVCHSDAFEFKKSRVSPLHNMLICFSDKQTHARVRNSCE
jgi:D-arabinose 1-dehydrogenase-like Zn-dependent alcohol dehydrogenase